MRSRIVDPVPGLVVRLKDGGTLTVLTVIEGDDEDLGCGPIVTCWHDTPWGDRRTCSMTRLTWRKRIHHEAMEKPLETETTL